MRTLLTAVVRPRSRVAPVYLERSNHGAVFEPRNLSAGRLAERLPGPDSYFFSFLHSTGPPCSRDSGIPNGRMACIATISRASERRGTHSGASRPPAGRGRCRSSCSRSSESAGSTPRAMPSTGPTARCGRRLVRLASRSWTWGRCSGGSAGLGVPGGRFPTIPIRESRDTACQGRKSPGCSAPARGSGLRRWYR